MYASGIARANHENSLEHHPLVVEDTNHYILWRVQKCIIFNNNIV